MATLIEIVCYTPQLEMAQPTIETFCNDTEGRLIGRRFYEETHEVVFMLQLPHATNLGKHMTSLSQALQQHAISSFRYLTCDLVQIFFESTNDLREQMHDFPLLPGEFWFPSAQNSCQVYVCINRPVMLARQAAWLLAHKVRWAFVGWGENFAFT